MDLLKKHETEFYDDPPFECTNERTCVCAAGGGDNWEKKQCLRCVVQPWTAMIMDLAYVHKVWKPPRGVRDRKMLICDVIRYPRGEKGYSNDTGSRFIEMHKRDQDPVHNRFHDNF